MREEEGEEDRWGDNKYVSDTITIHTLLTSISSLQ